MLNALTEVNELFPLLEVSVFAYSTSLVNRAPGIMYCNPVFLLALYFTLEIE